jgi:UDP-3-O-[3-hydroxymyristoyl] N-acetylglucosamine deacetylase
MEGSLSHPVYVLPALQHTLARAVSVDGIGVHSGAKVTLSLLPAPSNTGIIFERTDLPADQSRIEAKWDNVADTRLCSVIANKTGASVGTVEHVMAALAGAYIDNAEVHISGPELPIMDGSSAPFSALIEAAGKEAQTTPRRYLKVLREVRVTEGDKWATLTPATIPSFAAEVNYPNPVIGRQSFAITLMNGNFVHELAAARTFALREEVDKMQALGLAKGGSLENAIVVDGTKILNKGGLRHADEFVRHKLLDAVGDLALAGHPILGAYNAYKGGHGLNNKLLHALFAESSNYSLT